MPPRFGSAGRSLAVAAVLGSLSALQAGCSRDPGPIEIKVTKNGFDPALVRVVQGKPVELLVTRTTDETCATELVMPEAGLNVPLPLGKPVRITFTPPRAGRLRYSCAMGMFGGVVEVR